MKQAEGCLRDFLTSLFRGNFPKIPPFICIFQGRYDLSVFGKYKKLLDFFSKLISKEKSFRYDVFEFFVFFKENLFLMTF